MNFNVRPNIKAWVAALGGTLTAVNTFLATVTLAVGDDAISLEEVSSLTAAVVSLAGTVYGVWKVDNNK